MVQIQQHRSHCCLPLPCLLSHDTKAKVASSPSHSKLLMCLLLSEAVPLLSHKPLLAASMAACLCMTDASNFMRMVVVGLLDSLEGCSTKWADTLWAQQP